VGTRVIALCSRHCGRYSLKVGYFGVRRRWVVVDVVVCFGLHKILSLHGKDVIKLEGTKSVLKFRSIRSSLNTESLNPVLPSAGPGDKGLEAQSEGQEGL
jgi:hypothetical protein